MISEGSFTYMGYRYMCPGLVGSQTSLVEADGLSI